MAAVGSTKRMDQTFDRIVRDYPGTPAKTYTAAGVYDKVAILVALALVTGAFSYAANIGIGWVLVAAIVGFVCAIVGFMKPMSAIVFAPLYALVEGVALGGLSAAYATQSSSGIIPLAIIFTGGIFVAALIIFRSGLVRVTPKFMQMTAMACFGFIAVLVASAFGLPIPGLNSSGGDLVIGVIGVAIGTAFLFVDFQRIQTSEQIQLPAQAEWCGALMLMVSLVMVYINVLSILGRRR